MNNPGFQLAELIKRVYRVLKIKPEFNYPVAEVPCNLPKNKYLTLLRSLFPYRTEIKMSERIVEDPFVLNNLHVPIKSSILEIGCCRNTISLQLASLGYHVTACDLKYYPYKHPNLTFIQGDFRDIKFPTPLFDAVISISTIEHAGIGAYQDKKSVTADIQIMKKIASLLKPHGHLLVTVPYGKKEINSYERIYDNKSLNRLLKPFQVRKIEFYRGLNRDFWIPVTPQTLADVSSSVKDFAQGVACIVAQK